MTQERKASMKTSLLLLLLYLFLTLGISSAQVPVVGSPVSLDLGLGGGVSIPNGTFSDKNNSGYHAGAKARVHGLLPLNIVASGYYNRLSNKLGGESDLATMLGAGLELPVPSVIVNPYVGVDALWNRYTMSNVETKTRIGLDVGAGVDFSIPGLGSFDTSIKYQMFNLFGKENGEETLSQIAGNVTLMFSIL
jgi:hypothetical protein